LGYNLDLGGEGAAVTGKLIYSLEGLTLNLPGRDPADEMVGIKINPIRLPGNF